MSSSLQCGHCGYEIRRVAGLWCHVDQRAYAMAQHIAEPLHISNLSSDASASASDERPGATSPTTPEVEVAPGLPNIADTTIAQACERIDLLEQEVEALQRENARLKSWLVR